MADKKVETMKTKKFRNKNINMDINLSINKKHQFYSVLIVGVNSSSQMVLFCLYAFNTHPALSERACAGLR